VLAWWWSPTTVTSFDRTIDRLSGSRTACSRLRATTAAYLAQARARPSAGDSKPAAASQGASGATAPVKAMGNSLGQAMETKAGWCGRQRRRSFKAKTANSDELEATAPARSAAQPVENATGGR